MNITPIETKPKHVFWVSAIWQAREIVKREENTVGCVQENPKWSHLARIRRKSYSQYLSFGKIKRCSAGVLLIDFLACWDYLPSEMDGWICMGDWWYDTERKKAAVHGQKHVSSPLDSPQIAHGRPRVKPGSLHEEDYDQPPELDKLHRHG